MFQFHDTTELGVYDVRRGDQVIERFAVNLFDRQESDVRVRPTQDAKTERRSGRPIFASATSTWRRRSARRRRARKSGRSVLACALFVLVLEWYIYNRRVYL